VLTDLQLRRIVESFVARLDDSERVENSPYQPAISKGRVPIRDPLTFDMGSSTNEDAL
jgi:hypothetical protein